MGKKKPKRQPKKLAVDVIEAQQIILVDEYGTQRASLSCSGGDGDAGGYTVIHIKDDEGRPRIMLQVDDQGNPCICLFTRNNSPGVSMAVDHGHGNGLTICDSEGKPCIMLGIGGPDSNDPRSPEPEITMIDEHGRKVWTVFDEAYEIHENQNDVDAENTT